MDQYTCTQHALSFVSQFYLVCSGLTNVIRALVGCDIAERNKDRQRQIKWEREREGQGNKNWENKIRTDRDKLTWKRHTHSERKRGETYIETYWKTDRRQSSPLRIYIFKCLVYIIHHLDPYYSYVICMFKFHFCLKFGVLYSVHGWLYVCKCSTG